MYTINQAGMLAYTTGTGIEIIVDGLSSIKEAAGRNAEMMANHYIKPLQQVGNTLIETITK